MIVEYKCIDVYKKPENPMEWLPCPRCGLRPLAWEFDNGRFTACGAEQTVIVIGACERKVLCRS